MTPCTCIVYVGLHPSLVVSLIDIPAAEVLIDLKGESRCTHVPKTPPPPPPPPPPPQLFITVLGGVESENEATCICIVPLCTCAKDSPSPPPLAIYHAVMGGGGMESGSETTHNVSPGFCPHWSAVVRSNHHSAFLTTTQLMFNVFLIWEKSV